MKSVREKFETHARIKQWSLKRSAHFGDYMAEHVEWAWIGFCMALGADHTKEN